MLKNTILRDTPLITNAGPESVVWFFIWVVPFISLDVTFEKKVSANIKKRNYSTLISNEK